MDEPPGPGPEGSSRTPHRVRRKTSAVVGAVLVGILILSVVVLWPRVPAYLQPPVHVFNESIDETGAWNASWYGDVGSTLPGATYIASSVLVENRTNVPSLIDLKASFPAAVVPASGINFDVMLVVYGNISSDLRPTSLTTNISDYPGNDSDPVHLATFTSDAGPYLPSNNISYPKPLGYTGNGAFTGQGSLVDSVQLSGADGHDRFFFSDPSWADLFLNLPANNTTVYNTFHVSVQLNGITPAAVCEITFELTDHFETST